MNNPDHPLLNRAIQAQQAPGSTFKPIVALAGLETGAIDDNFHVNCGGGASFLRTLLQVPWSARAHGSAQRHRAILRRLLL